MGFGDKLDRDGDVVFGLILALLRRVEDEDIPHARNDLSSEVVTNRLFSSQNVIVFTASK